ncbi:hypothetical protein EIP91_012250 [Steccherinum ochraceum]|uniref:Protein kinase domain-containing protein n=1 Tax=Steccherinum ochraceum TaxID=92696 RepID=A0A4R0RKV7_9APHY|nr:hypothetical protein EIP91_012250 [Steccherinum ochraceum]
MDRDSSPHKVGLHFNFKSVEDHPAGTLSNYPICELETVGNPSILSSFNGSINVLKILVVGSRSTIYLGRLPGQKIEVVLKFASKESVIDEAKAYTENAEIQGSLIPTLYGVLVEAAQEGSPRIACLVLERFGKGLPTSFVELESTEKAKILDMLVASHRSGLLHLAFVENHALVKDSQYRLADLSYVKRHEPPCTWNYKFTEHVGEDACTEDRSSGCEAIWWAAEGMLFWNANKLRLYNSYYVKKNDDFPSQEQVTKMTTHIGSSLGTFYRREDLIELYERYFRAVKIAIEIDKAWHLDKGLTYEPPFPEANE